MLNGVELDVPLGFLPGGGTSVLPRALGLPRNPVKAAQRVAEGTTRRIGLGRVNGRRFGFNAGLGFDAELVRKVDELGRRPDGRRPGDIAFVRVAAAALLGRGTRASTSSSRSRERDAPRSCSSRTARRTPTRAPVALDLVPGADFDEGLAYLAPVSLRARDLPRHRCSTAHAAPASRTGKALAAHDLDRIVVRCDQPLPLQVDGEDAGDVLEAVYEAERDAVTVLV